MTTSTTEFLTRLNISADSPGASTGTQWFGDGEAILSTSPVDGSEIGRCRTAGQAEYEKVMATAQQGFLHWRRTWNFHNPLLMIFACFAALFLMGSLTACTNRDMATVGGAALGGVAGSAVTGGSVAGAAAGAVGGGLLGRALADD